MKIKIGTIFLILLGILLTYFMYVGFTAPSKDRTIFQELSLGLSVLCIIVVGIMLLAIGIHWLKENFNKEIKIFPKNYMKDEN